MPVGVEAMAVLSEGDGVGGVPLPPREVPRLAAGVAAREVAASRGVGVEGARRLLEERTGAERAGLLVATAFAGTVIGASAAALPLLEAGAAVAVGAVTGEVVAGAAAVVEAAGTVAAAAAAVAVAAGVVAAGNALAGSAGAVVVAGGVTAAAGGVRRDEGWREEVLAMWRRERTG